LDAHTNTTGGNRMNEKLILANIVILLVICVINGCSIESVHERQNKVIERIDQQEHTFERWYENQQEQR